MTTLLPSVSTAQEKAFEEGIAHEERLRPSIEEIVRIKHISKPANILPFLVFEYGLEPLRPYVPNLNELIDEGRQWARLRGTHKAVHDGMGFIGYAGALEDPPVRRNAWHEFQIALARLRDSEDDLLPIDGVVSLSIPARSKLRRAHHGLDIPAAENGYTRHGDALWGDDSGVRIDGSDVKWSFGRVHALTGQLVEADLTSLGVWIPNVPSNLWVDNTALWVDAAFPWSDPAEQSRRATIAAGLDQMNCWIRFQDSESALIGFRLAQSVPVRADPSGVFSVSGLSYAPSADDPTHMLVTAWTDAGNGDGQTATEVAAVFAATVPATPGRLWRTDLSGGVAVPVASSPIAFGTTVRERVNLLLEIT